MCSAHPWVIRAAAEQAAEDGSLLLVEATSNQVNQFGGYTGMRPAEFRDFVLEHVRAAGVGAEKLILGGDHLGPNPWRALPAAEAMQRAETMVAEYARAGFTKIHLDASMACGDDPERLSDEVVAERAARLCRAAESCVCGRAAGVRDWHGGAGAGRGYALGDMSWRRRRLRRRRIRSRCTSACLRNRVWGGVAAGDCAGGAAGRGVRPRCGGGVRPREGAARWWSGCARSRRRLCLRRTPRTISCREAYVELVQDGFAILKVGPALTFAMREALEALEDMESQLVPEEERSQLSSVLEETMLREPKDWLPYYCG